MARQHFKGEKRFKALAMIDISSEDKLNNDSDFNQLKKDPYFQSALSGYKNKKELLMTQHITLFITK